MILYGRKVPKTGWVHVYFGCMFSFKTGRLIVDLSTLEEGAGHKVQVYTPNIDKRYGDAEVTNHAGFRKDAFPIPIGAPVRMISELYDETTVVGIDEAQFYDKEIVWVVNHLARELGLVVILAGLDTDFAQRPFGSMPELITMANTSVNLYALCEICGGIATWTQRLVDGKPVHIDSPVIVVGAREQYSARCGDCHEIDRS